MTSNNCSAPITEKKIESRMIGPSSGKVMCQKRWKALARSSAASSSDLSMPWRPAM